MILQTGFASQAKKIKKPIKQHPVIKTIRKPKPAKNNKLHAKKHIKKTVSHIMPKHAMTKHAMPKHARPKHAMPKHAMPKHAMPKHAMPKHAMPKHAMPKHAMPKHAMPKHVMPKHAVLKINKTRVTQTTLPAYLLNSREKNLVKFVRNTVASLQYTAYKLGGAKIDTSRGIYIVDCSRYIDHILKNMYPAAYTSLTAWSGTDRPTTYDFYHYFTNLSGDSEHWNSVDDVEDLRPGDILVFRSKNRMSGHVMIVMDKPVKEGNTFLVRIADSAHSGHSKDTRLPHASGIGIGTLVLKVNPDTFKPYAYAWKVGSRWQHNVKFAMARPRVATVDFMD